MDCPSNHSMFLRANGSLACWCDYGNLLTLQAYDESLDYGKDVYLGRVFQSIRRKLDEETMPFPKYCSHCLCLANHEPYDDSYVTKRIVNMLHVEPTILCNLECPGCITQEKRKTAIDPPFRLDIGVLRKIFADFRDSNIDVQNIQFMGQGEPLLHKDVWDMVSLSRESFPGARLSMITNAHGMFRDECVDAGIDEIMFAIDGIDQESYEPYRTNGNFDKAYAFMSGFCRRAREIDKDIRTIWKYVLFAHNDSDEQLVRVQEMAADAGVREILFVITQLGPKSSRIQAEAQIPRLNNGVAISVMNYLVDAESIWRGVELAQQSIGGEDYAGAQEQLEYGISMLRRRFGPEEEIPADFQEIARELINAYQQIPEERRERSNLAGYLDALQKRLAVSELQARNTLVRRQAQKIQQQADLIATMEGSLSWRLTKSLRAMADSRLMARCRSRTRHGKPRTR